MDWRTLSIGVIASLCILSTATGEGGDSENAQGLETTSASSQRGNVSEEIIPHDAVMTYGKTATLRCEVSSELNTDKGMIWYHNDVRIVPDGEKYKTDDTNNTLTITHCVEDDIGEYQCSLELDNDRNYTQTVNLNALPYVHLFEPKSKNLVQGDPLVVHCKAWGHPSPIVTWLKDDEELDMSDERIKLADKDDLINGTLRIENLDYPDRADYTCIATVGENTANATLLVRVKDKLAALWPFLGICAEVLILCIIIFLYERHRSKKMSSEEEPPEETRLTNSNDHKGNDDVRQRKV